MGKVWHIKGDYLATVVRSLNLCKKLSCALGAGQATSLSSLPDRCAGSPVG